MYPFYGLRKQGRLIDQLKVTALYFFLTKNSFHQTTDLGDEKNVCWQEGFCMYYLQSDMFMVWINNNWTWINRNFILKYRKKTLGKHFRHDHKFKIWFLRFSLVMVGFLAVLVKNIMIYSLHLQVFRSVTCILIVKGDNKKLEDVDSLEDLEFHWWERSMWKTTSNKPCEMLYGFIGKERSLSVGISQGCLHGDHLSWAASERNKRIGIC